MSIGAAIFGADGLRLSKKEKAFFREAEPFGFILFSRNIEAPDQVYGLCSELRDAVGRDSLITIDQEGGRVQRLRGPIWRDWSPPLEFVRAAKNDAPRAMYLRYRLIAQELKSLTVDSNCAPMLDLAFDFTHEFLADRCYGTDPGAVTEIGRAVVEAHLAGGVLPVIKHMPGHGRTLLDSHLDLPRVPTDIEELSQSDFVPFRALNDAPLGMTAHLLFEAIDDRPATLSADMISLIRKDIGFDGLLMTDDIGMKALSGRASDISKQAIDAGCDLVLHCNGPLAERIDVANAVGTLNKAAQRRADAALAARKTPDEIDIADLNAELEALLGGRLDV